MNNTNKRLVEDKPIFMFVPFFFLLPEPRKMNFPKILLALGLILMSFIYYNFFTFPTTSSQQLALEQTPLAVDPPTAEYLEGKQQWQEFQQRVTQEDLTFWNTTGELPCNADQDLLEDIYMRSVVSLGDPSRLKHFFYKLAVLRQPLTLVSFGGSVTTGSGTSMIWQSGPLPRI